MNWDVIDEIFRRLICHGRNPSFRIWDDYSWTIYDGNDVDGSTKLYGGEGEEDLIGVLNSLKRES